MEPLLIISDIMRIFRIHKTSVYNWIEDGKIPAPIKISAKVARWNPREVKAAYAKMIGEEVSL
jgi:predicted DNA-binding transcriptional regulator AlpA